MIVIIGGPKTGKTTLSSAHPGKVFHTDDLQHLPWSEASGVASHWFDQDVEVIEGTMAIRALRKWLKRNPTGKPCDLLIYLLQPYDDLSRGQASMTRSIWTIFLEIGLELTQRGVLVQTGGLNRTNWHHEST